MRQTEQPSLRVEGKDDEHVIKNLLSMHDIDHAGVDVRWSVDGDSGGKSQLLEGMRSAVRLANHKPIGFVLDADEASENCWDSVRGRLEDMGLALPDKIPEGGFVGYTPRFQARTGVWLMPDNRRSGAIEEFLQDLIAREDALIQFAETSTDRAKEIGATFSDARRSKAVLHTWLAWRERPGAPYGTAIAAEYFQSDSPAAHAFVHWIQRVFLDPMPDP